MDAIETIELDGYVGEILYDESPENPRDMGDYHVSILTQLSSRFGQPDGSYEPCIVDAWERGYNWRASGSRGSGRGYSPDTELVERYARAFLGAVAVDWWDDPRSESRVFGYVTRDAVEAAGVTDPLAALNAELREYAAWCQGEVYGYTVTDPHGVEIDSCWGYYGDDELPYVRQCIADAIQSDREHVHAERVSLYKRLASS